MAIGVQYDAATGVIAATVYPAPDVTMPDGKGQIIVPDGTVTDGMIVDITQTPPILSAAPSSN